VDIQAIIKMATETAFLCGLTRVVLPVPDDGRWAPLLHGIKRVCDDMHVDVLSLSGKTFSFEPSRLVCDEETPNQRKHNQARALLEFNVKTATSPPILLLINSDDEIKGVNLPVTDLIIYPAYLHKHKPSFTYQLLCRMLRAGGGPSTSAAKSILHIV